MFCTIHCGPPRQVQQRGDFASVITTAARFEQHGCSAHTAKFQRLTPFEQRGGYVSTTTITRFEQRGSSPTASLVSSYGNARRPPHHHHFTHFEQRGGSEPTTTTSLVWSNGSTTSTRFRATRVFCTLLRSASASSACHHHQPWTWKLGLESMKTMQ